MIAALRNADMRLCQRCLETLPISEFRLRKRGGKLRHTKCGSCHAEDERERLARKRDEQNGKRIAKWATRIKNETDRKRIEYLVSVMFDTFGGPDGFAVEWSLQLQSCLRSNAGGKRALDGMAVLMKLTELAQPAEPDVDAMTDTELHHELAESVLGTIDDSPELVVEILRERGYVVIPPPEFPVESSE